jgi:hypothetical protein
VVSKCSDIVKLVQCIRCMHHHDNVSINDSKNDSKNDDIIV